MKFQSFRSAVVVASVIIGSVIPSQAFAEIDVLTGGRVTGVSNPVTSTYKFTGSMILNSIGFYTNGHLNSYQYKLSYTIGTVTKTYGTDFFANALNYDSVSGISWLSITPQSTLENDIVTVYTLGQTTQEGELFPETDMFDNFAVTPSANVSYVGVAYGGSVLTSYSNSNLRVSALPPSTNVAPEPGTLALTFTGGCALVGMYIRRRKAA